MKSQAQRHRPHGGGLGKAQRAAALPALLGQTREILQFRVGFVKKVKKWLYFVPKILKEAADIL